MYNIIEFDQAAGGGLAIVHAKWLTPRKKEVFWPPYKDSGIFKRALKKGEEVNEKTWHIYGIDRSFYETDDLDKAKRKLSLAEITSDLNTEPEENLQPQKRIRRPKRLYRDEESEEDIECRFKRPPKITVKTLEKDFDKIKESREKNNRNVRHCQQSQHITIFDANSSDNSNNTDITDNDNININTPKITPRSTPINEIDSNADTPQSLTSNFNQFAFNKKILQQLIIIKQQNKELLTILNKKYTQQINTCIPEDLPIQLPLKTNNDVTTLEEYLENNNNLSALSSYLASLGGNNISSRTNRMLKLLFTNDLASQYNFLGSRRQKLAFSKLQLCKCIIKATKLCDTESSEKQVEDAIKIWLKHAPQRMKNRRETV